MPQYLTCTCDGQAVVRQMRMSQILRKVQGRSFQNPCLDQYNSQLTDGVFGGVGNTEPGYFEDIAVW